MEFNMPDIAGGVKGIIYSCLAFSLAVEFLNIKLRGKQSNVSLNDEKDY